MKVTDIATTDSRTLRLLADGLKDDAKILRECGNKDESRKLFRLFRRITTELHRRRNPAVVRSLN